MMSSAQGVRGEKMETIETIYEQRHMADGVFDIVPVQRLVRCKDCKHNYANMIPSGDGCYYCVELPITEDFFCARGERHDR